MVAPAANHTTSNGDGSVGIAELNLVLAAIGKPISDTDYKVEADFNTDGTINLQDLNIQIAQSGKSIERGRLSGSGNIVGYAGYIFEPATGMYVVRHRWYSTENGRWLSRDPLGYVDGQGVYEYISSSSIHSTDPLGLSPMLMEPCGGANKYYVPWQPSHRDLQRREAAIQRARQNRQNRSEHSIVIDLDSDWIDDWSHFVAGLLGNRTRYNASSFEEMLDKLDDCEDVCIRKLVITGHGHRGCITLPYTTGDKCHNQIQTGDIIWMNKFIEDPQLRDAFPDTAYLEELFARLGDKLCDDGKLIFATCETGLDSKFEDNIEKFFKNRGKSIDVITYPYDVNWGFGSEPKRAACQSCKK